MCYKEHGPGHKRFLCAFRCLIRVNALKNKSFRSVFTSYLFGLDYILLTNCFKGGSLCKNNLRKRFGAVRKTLSNYPKAFKMIYIYIFFFDAGL